MLHKIEKNPNDLNDCISFVFRNLLRASAVSRFELNKAISFLQRKGYAKSMKELEMALEIPYEYSIFE